MKPKTQFFTKKICLTVEVTVGVNSAKDLTTDADLKAALEYLLNDGCDGRQMFSVETLKAGLRQVVEGSIHKAVGDAAYRRFPNKANLDGTSFACRLADHKLEKLYGGRVGRQVDVVGLETAYAR